MTVPEWITVASILLGYLLAGVLAYFNLRERVALLEQFAKSINEKLDEVLNGRT